MRCRVIDSYATHKHPTVLAWLSRHPRWIFHFTPTSASWLNAVENFFSKMTRQRIRRGVFRSIVGSAGPGSRPGASMSTKGYRGHNHAQRFRVWIGGQVRRLLRRSDARCTTAPLSSGDWAYEG